MESIQFDALGTIYTGRGRGAAGARQSHGLIVAVAFGASVLCQSASSQSTCTPDTEDSRFVCESTSYFQGNSEFAHLAISVAGWGDWDGDGVFDIVMGGMNLPFADFQEGTCPVPSEDTKRDKAWIRLSDPPVPSCSPYPCCGTAPCNQFGPRTLELSQVTGRGDRMGWSSAFLGDLDGDERDEIAFGAPLWEASPAAGHTNHGSAYVLFYRETPSFLPAWSDPEGTAGVSGAVTVILRGEQSHDWFGYVVHGAGNVWGDATPDLIVGAPSGPDSDGLGESGAPLRPGKVYVVDGAKIAAEAAGKVAGDTIVLTLKTSDPNRNAVLVAGPDLGSRFGWSVCGIGDYEGDAGNEIAVGAIQAWWQCTGPSEGWNYVGEGTGRVEVLSISSAGTVTTLRTLLGEQQGDLFGHSLSGAGGPPTSPYGNIVGEDVDKPDLIVGAPNFDPDPTLPEAGKVYVYSGAELDGGGPPVHLVASVETVGDDDLANFGFSVAGGGRLNDDGYPEYAVGERNFDQGQNAPPTTCMVAVGAAGLWDRGNRVGRVQVYCGEPITDASGTHHMKLYEFRGIQQKMHLGFSIAWLGPMDPLAGDFTELGMGAPGFAGCLGGCPPNGQPPPTPAPWCCSFPELAEVGRLFVWYFRP